MGAQRRGGGSMSLFNWFAWVALWSALLHHPASAQTSRQRLDLTGFIQADGAITTLRGGDIVEPYFGVQALLLAEENGLDAAAETRRWLAWLAPRQRLDGTFARFCQAGMAWVVCKPADADDALLAMWMKLLRSSGAGIPRELLKKNLQRSETALERLYDRSRGVYLVSPAFPHGLFMDNLEVWSFWASQRSAAGQAKARRLQRSIRDVFWHPRSQRFLVSTQPEQAGMPPAFYPDAVAQIYPLLFAYPALPAPARVHYQRWMKAHRATWLSQGPHDFAWGVLALIALRQGDLESTRCWLRDTAHLRHSNHWTVSDEVTRQILEARGLEPALATSTCR
jgi:hypothetical protein